MKNDNYISPGILKLSKNESILLSLIQNNAQSTPVSLAKLCNIPRPTIYITLERLKIRGLIDVRKFKKKKVWDIVEPGQIKDQIENIKKDLIPNKGQYDKLRVTDNTDLTIHRGHKAVLGLFSEFASTHNGRRLLAIHGNYSADAWSGIPVPDINKINREIKEKGLLTEMVSTEEWLKRQAKMFGPSWVEDFMGRTTQVHYIDSKYLNYESQVFIFGSKLYLVSMREQLFIEVKNQQIAKLIISLMQFVKDHSRSVDINRMLRELVKGEK